LAGAREVVSSKGVSALESGCEAVPWGSFLRMPVSLLVVATGAAKSLEDSGGGLGDDTEEGGTVGLEVTLESDSWAEAEAEADGRAAWISGTAELREAGFKELVWCITWSKLEQMISVGRRAWAPFRISPLRSSKEPTMGAAHPLRSRDGEGGWPLNQSASQCNKVDFCIGLDVSKAVVSPWIIDSRPSHAVAMEVSVWIAAMRIGAFWSARTVATGRTKKRVCFSNALPIPIDILETISNARVWTALLVSVTRAFSTCPISPTEDGKAEKFDELNMITHSWLEPFVFTLLKYGLQSF
jgi:hypothetical protein